jgi:hypothetical protein
MAKDFPDLADLQRAVDERTLLPSEDPNTRYVEDAVHWIRVYGELIAVKAVLLERAEQAFRGLTEDAVADLAIDQRLLRAQMERYKTRHDYWLNRVTQLAGTRRADTDGSRPAGLHIEPASDDDGSPAGSTEGPGG